MMIRILQVVNIMDRAGLETFLMNYYRNINRDMIQFDFLTHRDEIGEYEDEIKKLGGKVYHAPRLLPQNYISYMKWMKRFFKEHPEYKIVHSHIDAMSFWPLWAAARAGISVRIAHSHSTKIEKDYKYILKVLFKKLLPYVSNYYWTCGDLAGKFLFEGRDCTQIKNAINTEHFYYDQGIRTTIRNELNIQDSLVVGHVGRFLEVKNHRFLIEVFENIKSIVPDAKLLLVGQGELQENIKKLVKDKGLEKSVIFTGSRSDVNCLMQVMDVFVLPSLFEGVPVVGIEAQAAGLPCVFSDKVPREVGLSENSKFLSLSIGAQKWAEQIVLLKNENRKNGKEIVKESGYDITSAAQDLMKNYQELYYEG